MHARAYVRTYVRTGVRRNWAGWLVFAGWEIVCLGLGGWLCTYANVHVRARVRTHVRTYVRTYVVVYVPLSFAGCSDAGGDRTEADVRAGLRR